MDWRDYITTDPLVCHGQPCIAGTRILVSIVLDNLAANTSREALRESYPTLTDEAIEATLRYAADLARERTVALPTC